RKSSNLLCIIYSQLQVRFAGIDLLGHKHVHLVLLSTAGMRGWQMLLISPFTTHGKSKTGQRNRKYHERI
ncbi:MAG: hypothetical protein KKG34_04400, partial [Proteobacteria bacterium]|nr:hypothetical protein [Pseudomonadota bacterium]